VVGPTAGPPPLATFGWLEVGVAITALTHFVLVDVYEALEPALLGWLRTAPMADTLVKAGVAAVLLLPASFLMGGTLPTLGEHVVAWRGRLGRTVPVLYATNTLG
jgi:spermidine synthase